jgi:hypothetical protein
MTRSNGRWCFPALLLILFTPVAGLKAQVRIRASGGGGLIEHQVQIDTREGTAGPAATIRLTANLRPWLEVQAFAAGGELRADSITAHDERLTEVQADARILATPWLSLGIGGRMRTYRPEFGLQRWIAGRALAEAQMTFGDAVRGVVGAEVMPLVSVSGQRHPNLAIGAMTGIRWQGRRFNAGLSYAAERYRFPPRLGVTRVEHLSSLMVEFGLTFGSGTREGGSVKREE